MILNTGALHDNIPKLFHRLVEQILQQNSLNRSNQTVDAEDLFCNILNLAFDWNLVNANLHNPNQDTFDLYSIDNKRFVQITSNQNHKAKLEQTLQSAINKGYEQIVIIFITKALPDKFLKEGQIGNTEFKVDDVNTLYRKIRYTSLPDTKLQQINDSLENFTKPILSYEFSNSQVKVAIGLPTVKIPDRKSRFFIERTELIAQLYQYTQKNNGLIIGGPGTGKSFTVREFQRFCSTSGVPCYVIPVNELLGATDEDICKELSISNGDWIEILRSNWSVGPNKGILIFDGFDTAKDESVKKDVLIQMQRAIDRLSSDWCVLASVRTYDAGKSERLVQMFPHVTTNNPITCRTFTIPELTVPELHNFLTPIPRLIGTYQKCTKALQQLLLIPYFLGLFVDVVNDTNGSIQPLLEVETEEQLLKIYWQRKVAGNTLSNILLLNLTNELLRTQKLSCKKVSLLADKTYVTVLEDLLSMGVLSESPFPGQLVSFNHNILLEYAVSIYTIPEESAELILFITENPRQLFSFRQSFVYFYSRLWAIDNQLFWGHYNLVRSSKVPILKLFHQSVLNYVLGSFYQSYDQLKPILKQPDKNERDVTIKKLLEGIRFLKKQNLTKTDDEIFFRFSKDLSVTYAWQLGFLIDRAIDELNPEQDTGRWIKLSEAADLYLNWVLTERQVPGHRRPVDVAAGRWGIRNVCKTYSINPDRAFKLLQQAILVFNEQEFPLGFYQEFESHVASIFESNRQTGASLFKALYLFNETSSKETTIGSTIMPFRSNRGQDFKMLHHRLENRYDELLDIDIKAAILLGLEIVNETYGNHKPHRRAWKYSMLFDNQPVTLVSDSLFFDSNFDKDYGPLSLLHKLLQRIEGFLQNNNIDRAENYVKLFVHAKAARIWRGLLQLFSKYPERTKMWGLPLIQSEAIAICDETTQMAAETLMSLWPFLTTEEKVSIERSILQLQYTTSYQEEQEFLIGRIKRFVGVLLPEELQLEDTKQFIEKHGTIENRPIVQYLGMHTYEETEEEKLNEAGVNKDNETELTAFRLIEVLTNYTQEFINLHDKNPTPEQLSSFLPLTRKLISSVQSNHYNERLTYKCDSIISEVIELFSRIARQLNPEDLLFVQEVALRYIHHPSYQLIAYETGANNEQEKVYSQTPRTKATTILINLLFAKSSDVVASTLEKLFSDNSKTVRLYATSALNWFYHYRRSYWLQIIPERIAIEQYEFTYCELIHRANYHDVIRDNQVFVETLVTQVEQQLNIGAEPLNHAGWEKYTYILLQLLALHKSKIASDIVFRNANNAHFVEDVGRFVINYIDPKSANSGNIEAKHYLLGIIQKLLVHGFKILQSSTPDNIEAAPFYQMLDRLVSLLWGIFGPTYESGKESNVTSQVKEDFYRLVKPLIILIIDESEKIGSGFMMGHTAYSLVQLLYRMLSADAIEIFSLTTRIVNAAAAGDFTYDEHSMKEIVRMVETILADHRVILTHPEVLQNLIILLDHFTDSGWEEPLELVWRIKDAF